MLTETTSVDGLLAESSICTYSTYTPDPGIQMPEEYRAALFTTGGSQAVRLPAAFRFEGKYVRARREGHRIILEPLEKLKWPASFWRTFDRTGPVTDDFRVPGLLPATPHRDDVLGQMDADAPET